MSAGLFLPLALWLLTRAAQGQTFELLHSFPSQNGGFNNPLVKGRDGSVYGLVFTNNGPDGSLVRVDSNGKVTNLVYLKGVYGRSLVQGSDGSFYCTGDQVFRVSLDGTVTTLSTNRPGPSALVLGSDGNFYGPAGGGLSVKIGGGTLFFGTLLRMTPSGSLTTLVQFDGTDGVIPETSLVPAGDGSFYGTTYGTGSAAGGYSGTVFNVTTNGALTTLASFFGPGPEPGANLVLGTDGSLYGTTYLGGAYGLGQVFKVTLDGTLTTLVDFDGNNGQHPGGGLVLAHDGNFYGTTVEGGTSFGNPNALNGSGYGTVFQMTPDGTLTTVHSFDGSDGMSPEITLVEGPDGNLYGTTYFGTRSIDGPGMLFRIVLPQPTPPPRLALALNGNQVVLSWPTNAVGFTLQSSSDLNSSANWTDSTDSPVIVADQYFVTNSTFAAAQFYRLKK